MALTREGGLGSIVDTNGGSCVVSVVLTLLPKVFLKWWWRRWSRRFALMSALKKMHLVFGSIGVVN